MTGGGGEVDPDDIVRAALAGGFPMDDDPHGPIRFYTADPRTVLPPGALRVPRSVRRALRRSDLETRADTAFDAVVAGCMTGRAGGVWLTPRLARAYGALHRRGLAGSVEIWLGGRLVAGMFGLRLGAFASGESMFHRLPDSGNVLLVRASEHLAATGATLWDIQMTSRHLARFGAVELPRGDYLARLAAAVAVA